MAYSKVIYKYLFKDFYRLTNKKKYKLQILEHNIYYINIIAMQNIILIAKSLISNTKKSLLLIRLIQKLRKYIV